MIFYKLCSEANIDDIYEAFRTGFSDYIIKIEMPKEMFVGRFFGPEGNALNTSHIAYDENKPVGVILGGIKDYEGIKTMRCGTLCIHPDYRGKGISQKLFELHKQTAIDNNCRQLFLEVIVGNDRAIAFYKKQVYEKVYDLAYFSLANPSELQRSSNLDCEIKQIDFNDLKELGIQLKDIHINWQNDFDYIEKSEGYVHFGAYRAGKLIGALSAHPMGRVSFLWVEPQHRLQGIAKDMLAAYIAACSPKKLAVSFPNNAKLEGFIKHLGFTRDAIAQYEMYLTI